MELKRFQIWLILLSVATYSGCHDEKRYNQLKKSSIIDSDKEVSIYAKTVEIKRASVLINDSLHILSGNRLKSKKPSWLKDTTEFLYKPSDYTFVPTIRHISPPYFLFKQKDSPLIMLIKNKDTMIFELRKKKSTDPLDEEFSDLFK